MCGEWRAQREGLLAQPRRAGRHARVPRGAAPRVPGGASPNCSTRLSRRTFLKLMGASLALAGVTACTSQPAEKIVPTSSSPRRSSRQAALLRDRDADGRLRHRALVESHEDARPRSRATRTTRSAAGPPTSFAGLGARPLRPGPVADDHLPRRHPSVERFPIRARGDVAPRAPRWRRRPAAHGHVTSPTLMYQIPPAAGRAAQDGLASVAAGGPRPGPRRVPPRLRRYADAPYRLDQAHVILALDADLLAAGPRRGTPGSSPPRAVTGGRREMNRLYVLPTLVTGSVADHACRCRPGSSAPWRSRWRPRSAAGSSTPPLPGDATSMFRRSHATSPPPGTSLVVAGDDSRPRFTPCPRNQPGARQRRPDRLYTEPVEAKPTNQLASLRRLAADMGAGKVETLVVIDSHPLYTRRRISSSTIVDEQGPPAGAPRAETTTPRRSATGRSPRRTTWNRRATRARATAPC